MNLSLLNTEIQEFITKNLNADISKLVFKGSVFKAVSNKEIVAQIEAKNKCKLKLPTWFSTGSIYFPNKLNIEQTSSELTADYKSRLISGDSLIDITGGFGVDSFYFSKHFKHVTHCEIQTELSSIARHNFEVLNVSNIECINDDGIAYLKNSAQNYNWIFIDPSRRHQDKGKVFYLKDCEPNLVEHLDNLLEYSNNIMIKVSPMLDISMGISELNYVKEIHVVAIHNEVKELLYIIEKNYKGEIKIKTVNFAKEVQKFEFYAEEELNSKANYSSIKTYLYEPNAALLKSGAFNLISTVLNLDKLHVNTHLYTSEELIRFPGRVFKVDEVLLYQKKILSKKMRNKQYNIATRNFPERVQELKTRFKIKDGGDCYIFFTTDVSNKRVVIFSKKA